MEPVTTVEDSHGRQVALLADEHGVYMGLGNAELSFSPSEAVQLTTAVATAILRSAELAGETVTPPSETGHDQAMDALVTLSSYMNLVAHHTAGDRLAIEAATALVDLARYVRQRYAAAPGQPPPLVRGYPGIELRLDCPGLGPLIVTDSMRLHHRGRVEQLAGAAAASCTPACPPDCATHPGWVDLLPVIEGPVTVRYRPAMFTAAAAADSDSEPEAPPVPECTWCGALPGDPHGALCPGAEPQQ